MNYRFILFKAFVVITFILASCAAPDKQVFILIGDNASKTEQLTAQHIRDDVAAITGINANIVRSEEKFSRNSINFVIGTPSSNSLIDELVQQQVLILTHDFPENRGGIREKVELEDGHKCIVLAGNTLKGMQYAVYDYSHHVLGIDPLAYWTLNKPEKNSNFDLYSFSNKILTSPEVPILCYFENDVDELANLKAPFLEYDWESYTQMINSLVRLKYNAIHLFDMLGRPEFFLREEYKKVRPDYDIRFSYIDSLINYAQDMGMMVQIDFSLGYKIHPMEQDKADCWTEHKDAWIETWRYYFEHTPLRKADIISLRPRNQVWDWEYKSACGEDKTAVFNEVYVELGKLIDEYKPDAIKVATCYTDGMEMFNNGFNPPKDWIIAWSDDGFGGFKYLPEDTKGYDFGAYMHAGFWRNHTVHNPYPEKIDSVMKMMKERYGANKYYQVNGQQFRPFLLNIEAFAKIADSPENFNGEQFYKNWTTRYFDKAAPFAVKAMQKLHEAQFDNSGYVQHLWEIKGAISYLSDLPITRPGRKDIPPDFERVSSNVEHVKKRMEMLSEALEIAKQGEKLMDTDDTFYHDYIVLPIQLYFDLIYFEHQLHNIALQKREFEKRKDPEMLEECLVLLEEAKIMLQTLTERRLKGDKNEKWASWYDPAKRRPNHGFPTIGMLNVIENNLKNHLT